MRLPRKMAASFINMDASWPRTLDSEFQNLTCILTAIRIRKSNCPMKKQLPTWTNLNPHIKTLTAPGTLRPERRGLRPKPNGRYDSMETKKWELQVAIEVGSKNGIDESTGWFFNDANSSDFLFTYGTKKSITGYSWALLKCGHCSLTIIGRKTHGLGNHRLIPVIIFGVN